HNFFLEGYLVLGLPFALLLLATLTYLIWIFYIGYHTRHSFRFVSVVGAGILVLVLLHSMVDFSLQIPGVSAYFAAALAAAIAISLGRRSSTRSMMELPGKKHWPVPE